MLAMFIPSGYINNMNINKIKSKAYRFYKYLTSFYPTKLPIGVKEFDQWASDIISLSQAPDNYSVKWALAVMIMHLDSTTDTKPKRYFVRALNKASANQVASALVQDYKKRQQDEMNAQLAKAADEAKATEQRVS